MNTEWLGRYRKLVAALVQHTNINLREINKKIPAVDGMMLSMQEWQVLEYIIEHEADDAHMIHISSALGIPQSSFSKIARQLYSLGLIERYRTASNKKNVILKPSEKGHAVYDGRSNTMTRAIFQPFFDRLSNMPDQELAEFVDALNVLNETLIASQKKEQEEELIRL